MKLGIYVRNIHEPLMVHCVRIGGGIHTPKSCSFLAEIINILAKVELFTYINDVLIILRMVFKLCTVGADYENIQLRCTLLSLDIKNPPFLRIRRYLSTFIF